MEDILNYINGEFVKSESNEYIDVIEPATGETYGRVVDSNQNDVYKAIDAANNSFLEWSSLSIKKRAEYLNQIADVIENTPLRVRRLLTNPMRRTLVSRSSLLNPRPLLRFVLTTSPSSSSTFFPLSASSETNLSAIVVLPLPERPVNHTVTPFSNVSSLNFRAI